MRIFSYGCKNYKPFKDGFSMELRPLTLIFGKNSAGKSAAVRLLRLILRALSDRAAGAFPLDVGDVSFGEGFRDLVHGKLPVGAVTFEIKLEMDGELLDLSADVQDTNQSERWPASSFVSKLQLRVPVQYEAIWTPEQGLPPSYGPEGPITFRGLFPDTPKKKDRERWGFAEDWRERIQGLEDRIAHLGPSRAPIKRFYGISDPATHDFNGGGAPASLAKDPSLLTATSKWYQQHLDGWNLSLDRTSITFECTLSKGTSSAGAATSVNLCDAGQGMQQVLPVVAQQLSRQLNHSGPFLDLVEQPELHLHTAAQAPLGDLFLETAKTGRGQVIVETHSENLLLRIRRRIVEGADPGLVAVYWIEDLPQGFSTVRRIHIDRCGELDWWSPGVFSEGYEEVLALRRAARTRQVQ